MSVTRQLAAILFADMQDYTAVMQRDEAQAKILREKFQKNLKRETAAHNGRVVQYTGDGAFCNFSSAIEAVRAAIEIQKRMMEEPRVPLRIGIHSGDVVIDQDNMYGDGVNVASRIESFAVAGAVFISGKVFDEIKNQKDIMTASLGTYQLKNVATPVEIFAISNAGLIVPKKEKLQGKGTPYYGKKILYNKKLVAVVAFVILLASGYFLYNRLQVPRFTGKEKSIAVLPFANLSGDKDNEYFSDGITEDIITRLSNVADLRVISRTSVMRYKNTTRSTREIAKDLGVAAILTGSVQKEGNRVHVTAQLVDAATDRHLWAENYDRELKDIFQVQSDLSELIAISLNASITKFQKSRIDKKPTENTDAYLLYQRGIYLWNKRTRESITNSITLYQQALALDSNFALAYAAISLSYHSMFVHPVKNEDSIISLMMIYARRALAVDPYLGAGHTALGAYYAFDPARREMALRELDRAIELDPNYSYSWLKKGMLFHENGEPEKSLSYIEHALQLDPLAPTVLLNKAIVLNVLGRCPEAQEVIGQIEMLEPDFATPYFNELRVSILLNLERFPQALDLSRYAGPKHQAYAFAATGNRGRAIEIRDSLQQAGNNEILFRTILQFYLEGKDAVFDMIMNEIKATQSEGLQDLRENLMSSDMFVTAIRSDPRFETIKQMVGWKPLQ